MPRGKKVRRFAGEEERQSLAIRRKRKVKADRDSTAVAAAEVSPEKRCKCFAGGWKRESSSRNVEKKEDEGRISDGGTSEEESEWEEVEPLEEGSPDSGFAQPSTSGSIEINLFSPKSKTEIDAETVLRREISRFQKQQREEIHKAHLLCYIAHGRYLLSLTKDPLLRACALSLIPEGFCRVAEMNTVDVSTLERFSKWFKSAFICQSAPSGSGNCAGVGEVDLVKLHKCFETKTATSSSEFATIFVTFLRVLEYDTRLVFSCSPGHSKQKDTKSVDNSAEKPKEVPKKSQKGRTLSGKSKLNLLSDKKMDEFYWAEVFVDTEERWICLDWSSANVDSCSEIETKCPQPLHYVLGFDNDGGARDLTARYSSSFLTSQVRKLRLKDSWWQETLPKFRSRKYRQRDRVEDFQLRSKFPGNFMHHKTRIWHFFSRLGSLTEQPLPTTISEFKNHPLYRLKRNLLKFEEIYPSDTEPVGFIGKEPIYPRSCIRTLHSKESWIKEARVIRVGEEPYKTVKARPKMGIPKSEQPERQLHLYGYWQTEAYIPPPVVNGVIPRNEYGNVEVFQPSMIPPGTVHLHDGWIVCEEHKETLLAGWDHWQAVEEEKQKEKKKDRALKNWRRLCKGLLLRNAMREKFKANIPKRNRDDIAEETLEDSCINSSVVSWPQCRRQFNLNK